MTSDIYILFLVVELFLILCFIPKEILVDLREALLQVARHFMSVDPKLSKVVLVPDYGMESHARDHNNYVNVSRTRKRRAKALLGECVRKENVHLFQFHVM
jgi:hypothetical protein